MDSCTYDADQQNYPYLKRFTFEASSKRQNYLGENKHNQQILLSQQVYPRIQVIFGGHDSFREAQIIEPVTCWSQEFKAKGKRLTTYSVDRIKELEPTRMPEPEILEEDNDSVDTNVPEEEENGQMKLF